MEINIEEENKNKINQLAKDKNLAEYDKFYKKEDYKVSLINVDSAFREKNPKNIYSTNVTYLPKDPLTFTEDLSLITFHYPNHNLNQGDNIDLEIPFDKRTLNVSFNKSGLDKSLIESLIKSLSIQVSMQKTGKKPEPLRGKIRNGQSFIEVKLKDAQNKDLAQVKTILELL